MNNLANMEEFFNLEINDEVKLTDGRIMKFIKRKRIKFSASFNGVLYDVPNSMFVCVVKKAERDLHWYNKLKTNDLFYIIKGKDCVAFRFKCMRGREIIGMHLKTNTEVRIDSTFDGDVL